MAPKRYHCSSNHALELICNSLRMMALVALTNTTTRVSQVTARPTLLLRRSIQRENNNKSLMAYIDQQRIRCTDSTVFRAGRLLGLSPSYQDGRSIHATHASLVITVIHNAHRNPVPPNTTPHRQMWGMPAVGRAAAVRYAPTQETAALPPRQSTPP